MMVDVDREPQTRAGFWRCGATGADCAGAAAPVLVIMPGEDGHAVIVMYASADVVPDHDGIEVEAPRGVTAEYMLAAIDDLRRRSWVDFAAGVAAVLAVATVQGGFDLPRIRDRGPTARW
ncbi:hypothetical protein [Azospirillum sp. ST 5-10]|uniref:hypothetical protein n=1 Tax=unclassified Azospirillum TaxID=2630922 RepID=UPI003F49F617